MVQPTHHGRSDISQQSSDQHADWYHQYSHCLLSLLTCLRPTSSPPLITEVQDPSSTLPPSNFHAAFPSPVLPADPPCPQEPVLSFPSPASLDAHAKHFFDGCQHRRRTLYVTYAPYLLRSDGFSFDSTTVTGVVSPPHAEPPLAMSHNNQDVPNYFDRSELFELVSPPSTSAVNGDGGHDHVDAHACGTDFTGLDPRFSESQTDR